MSTSCIRRNDVMFLWHPGGEHLFSGFGLPTAAPRMDLLVGLLLIDRPVPAPKRWLNRVKETFGDYALYPMSLTHERGIACCLRVEEASLLYVRKLDRPLARQLVPTLARLLAEPPKPRLVVSWNQRLQLWVSRFDLDGEENQAAPPAWPLFRLGKVVATPAALAALEENGQTAFAFLDRHVTGDWGNLVPEDEAENARALVYGSRLFSSYVLADGSKLWIITEHDRSVTTLLLPSDY